ncbi:MAG: HIT family protein [Patescibacteria group bacterium]
MIDCLFCKIVAGEIPSYKIWENEHFLAFLDINPVNLGHTLLVPKAHFVNLFDLPAEMLTEWGPAAQAVAKLVQASTEADGINLEMNNGRAAGQLINHAHLHIVPRFEGDGFLHWKGKTVPTPAELKAVCIKITSKS